MTESINGHRDHVLDLVLHQWEGEQPASVVGFDAVLHRIATAPSPTEAPRWGALRSLRLAGALTGAQVRVVPRVVFPVALGTTALAMMTARFFGVLAGGQAAEAGFAAVVLLGLVVTLTATVSPTGPDQVSLSTPLGPETVLVARVVAVVLLDSVTAGIGSAGAVRYASGWSSLLAAWLVPMALVAGVTMFVAIWAAPWVGFVAGALVMPTALPASDAFFSFGLAGLLWRALPPVAIVLVGLVVVGACVATVRRASEKNLQMQ